MQGCRLRYLMRIEFGSSVKSERNVIGIFVLLMTNWLYCCFFLTVMSFESHDYVYLSSSWIFGGHFLNIVWFIAIPLAIQIIFPTVLCIVSIQECIESHSISPIYSKWIWQMLYSCYTQLRNKFVDILSFVSVN